MRVRKVFTLKIVLFLAIIIIFAHSLLAQTFDVIKSQVNVHLLENGMKFIVLERHAAPVVSFHVHADVGSANESYGITGISHLLEHMAFKGTRTVGTKDYEAEAKILRELDVLFDRIKSERAKAKPDKKLLEEMEEKFETLRKKAKEYVITEELWDMLMKEGDRGLNAYTSRDVTVYTDSLPSNKVEFWTAITSDRFLDPVFREFYKEKDVVMEERRLRVESWPVGQLFEDFFAAAFKAHPYGHSLVGNMSDLQSITRKDVEEYFRKFYIPSNLTVGIVGDVKAEEVFQMAEVYFGRIPSGPKPESIRTKEPEQWGERRVAVEARSQPMIVVGYHCPDLRHKDSIPVEALANIMGQGRSSRLYQVMVKEKKIAAAVEALSGYPAEKFPNLIVFYAVPSLGHTAAECLEIIDEEVEKMKKEPVTPEELTKFKRGEVKSVLNKMKSNADMAELLTYADVVLGDWRLAFDQIKEIRSVTADDVKRVANKYLIKKQRTIGEIVPEK